MEKAINLGIFASENIQKATLSLLLDLGIEMEVRSEQQILIPTIVAASLGNTPKAVQDICDKISESYLAGIISDKTFTGDDDAASFEEACENADKYEQMMVFAVDFKKNEKITRTEMATLTRSLNRASKACPVVLVCRYVEEKETRFAISLCERTTYKQAGHTGEKAGKVNILRGINPQNPHTGHVRILEDMRLEKKENTFGALYAKWLGVFDNDVLTEQFYKELQDWFFWAVKYAQFPNDINDDTDDKKYNPQNVIRLITRLIFIWFLRQKGLVPKELFNREDLDSLVKDFEPDNFESSTYYRVILQNLFFATLNRKIEDRAFISDNFIENRNQGKHNIKTFMRHAKDLAVPKEEFIKLVHPVPFMNNSLFECLDNREQNGHKFNWDGFSESNKPQRQAFVPNYLFFAEKEYVDLSEEYDSPSKSSVKVSGLLTILKRYNFTVEENTPLDQDVALDPELLGKVFENLLAAYNPETEKTVRKSTGSYYTPRPIVQYMVDESLIAYLKKAVPNIDEETLRSLLSYSDDNKVSILNEKQTHDIVEALLNCKVLDPACGSGAFPMGMLQQMSHLLRRVDATNKYWEEVVIHRALTDEAFVSTMNDEEKEAHKREIEEVFKLSINYPDYARKLYLIENCIYGIDVQSIAVQITRLRFFISLLCEQQPSKDANKNYNIKPLPNLEMKFVCANSLVKLENIDKARELFANKDILSLIAKLKGVRHELFVVTDQHVKERLLSKDETLRGQIMLSTGDCYVKGTEDKIEEYEKTISHLEKELANVERQPDDIIQQSVQHDLFGEKKEIVVVNRKELKIKEITSNIRYFKRECKRLKETLTSGRDKAVRLAKQLTDWNPYDQNISSPFFDSEWMFGIKDGFDIVIGNPPYFQVAKGIYSSTQFPYSEGKDTGKQNMYKLFVEHSYNSAKENGIACMIVQSSLMCDMSSKYTRELLLRHTCLEQIIEFPKTAPTPAGQVFANVCQGTCIYLFRKSKPENKTFILSVNNDCTTLQIMQKEIVSQDALIEFYPEDYAIPLLKKGEFDILKKIKINSKKLDDIIYGIAQGDMNLTTSKNKITLNKTAVKLLRGRNVASYYTDYNSVTEYICEDFKQESVLLNNSLQFIVCQEISGTVDPRRIHTALTDTSESFLCGHTINKIRLKDITLNSYIIGLLNSTLMDWVFRKTSSNNHVGGYELKQLPIIIAEDTRKIETIVNSIISAKKQDLNADISELEIQLDDEVYTLYGIKDEDRKLIADNYA